MGKTCRLMTTQYQAGYGIIPYCKQRGVRESTSVSYSSGNSKPQLSGVEVRGDLVMLMRMTMRAWHAGKAKIRNLFCDRIVRQV